MSLTLYNTLTRKKEEFQPVHPPQVGVYLCGPTVYSEAHLGNARGPVVFDVLPRYLRHLGYQVRYVRNVTDVGHLENDADTGEDKMEKAARAARIARSPYPVLLAGDLNDPPYSYTSDQLADELQNAWATVGLGPGFTYNGRLPGLRIDQQFAGPQWQVRGCRVHREINWSDHFPVEAVYRLR